LGYHIHYGISHQARLPARQVRDDIGGVRDNKNVPFPTWSGLPAESAYPAEGGNPVVSALLK